MKKFIFSLFLIQAIGLNAQLAYNTAIGLRGGETSGLTIKKSLNGAAALEGILGIYHHGLSATLLYEKYKPTTLGGLNWYYGLGGHAAVFSHYYERRYYFYDGTYAYSYYQHSRVGLGVDGVLGLEYKIPKAPIALSLDIKPYVEVNNRGGIWTSLDPGLGIKVAF